MVMEVVAEDLYAGDGLLTDIAARKVLREKD